MGPLAAIVWALAATHVQVADGSTQQCYVCEPRGVDPTADSLAAVFKDQLPVLKCEDFKKDDSRFIKNCPAGSQGCLTQSVAAGHHTTRTCADVKINDCPVANGVQYCYCSGALCNGQSHDPPPDDEPEDSVEGSASGEEHRTRHPPGTVPTTPAPTTHASQSHVKSGAQAARTLLSPLLATLVALALLAV